MSTNNKQVGPINILFAVALATDLLVPLLIWKGLLPPFFRWLSHGAVAVMIFGAYARMMAHNRVPGVVWVIVGSLMLGMVVALSNGQGIVPTLWGGWLMYQYPLVGLFAYLQPTWPESFPQRLRALCVAILGLEVLVQVAQYVTGQSPGDNLAGTFGEYGTGNLVLFIALVSCLALGEWLTSKRWMSLVLVLVLGSISSVLGEMKLFLLATTLLGGIAIAVAILQGRGSWQMAPLALLLIFMLILYLNSYNALVPGASGAPIQRYLTTPQALARYLGRAERSVVAGRYYYDIGRNYAVAYGWNTIQRTPLTFIFGMGLGARGESRTLGTAGVGLVGGNLGLATGTSLLVIMQETGVVGLSILAGFVLWAAITLIKDIRSAPQSEANELRYALLLFTLLWPLWLWYNTAWTLRVPMLLYWVAMGYVMRESARGPALGWVFASGDRKQAWVEGGR